MPKYSDIALPSFYTDPKFEDVQNVMFPFGTNILQGEVPEFYKPITDIGGPVFEDYLSKVKGDITQQGLETGARLKMRGPRLGAGISKAIGDVLPGLRWTELLRGLGERERLMETGIGVTERVGTRGLEFGRQRNVFELEKTGLAMNLAQAEEAKKKAKADRWAKIIESTIKGGAIMAAMALPGGGATASTMARGGAGGGGGTQFGGGSYDLQNILYGMK